VTNLSTLLPPASVGNAIGTLPAVNGGTGLTSPGAAGNLLASNGTAWVSQAPAPSSSALTATASGSLSDGSRVIVNSDGTVSVVSQSVQSSPTFGTASQFVSNTENPAATYDSVNMRVVVAYRDQNNSGFGTAVVGTVSGSSISFGTPTVFNSAVTSDLAATYHSAARCVVIAYQDQGLPSWGRASIGVVGGTGISFIGSAVTFSSAQTLRISATYDANAQRVVIAYRNNGDAGRGYAVVGTVSGVSISFGTPVVFNSGGTPWTDVAYDSAAQRVVIAYTNDGNSSRGTAIVGTVSGTSISFGTAVVFQSSVTPAPSVAYDANAQRVVIAYIDNGNSNRGTAIVGTVSGTSISFGTAVVFNSANTTFVGRDIDIVYDGAAQRVVIAYRNGGDSNRGTAIIGTVSGTSISFSTATVFNNTATSGPAMVYDTTAQRFVVSFRGDSPSSGFSIAGNVLSTNLTAENFIGFSNAAYVNGQTATIQIVGAVDDAQTGLTPGEQYFVQPNGTLALTPGSPSVFAGTAIAANRIEVKR
jgi:hypothetical protein